MTTANREELPQRLLKVTEVAGYLSLSRGCIYQLMERGQLAYVKIGKSRRIRPEDVARLIDAGLVGQRA